MQPVRQVVHALGDPLRARQCLGGHPLGFIVFGAAHQLEIHRQQRHLLVDVVVQFACDPRSLGFLRLQQSRPEVADSLVARQQMALALAQLDFGTAPSHALNRAAPQSVADCTIRRARAARM